MTRSELGLIVYAQHVLQLGMFMPEVSTEEFARRVQIGIMQLGLTPAEIIKLTDRATSMSASELLVHTRSLVDKLEDP